MAKSKPIGVRFDQNMLDVFKEDGIADSPQKALNFLHAFYLKNRNDKTDFTELFSKSKLFANRPKDIKDSPPKSANSKEKRIEAIGAEKEPEWVKTPLGRQSWKSDQKKRILAIQNEKDE